MRQFIFRGALYALLGCFLFGATALVAQSDADKQTIQKAKANYYTGPAPGSIACDISIDWDKFVKALNMPMNDEQKAQMEQMKNMKLSFVSTGEKQTEVKVDLPPTAPPNLSNGLQQQVQGLMQTYWSLGYGDFFPKDGEAYELAAEADGYSINETKDGTKAKLSLNKDYQITGLTVDSTPIAMDMKTTFAKEDDNLLHVRQLNESVSLGDTKMVVTIGLDYQKVSGFYLPQHASMSVGPLEFDYTLANCVVTAKKDVKLIKDPGPSESKPSVNLDNPAKAPAAGANK